MARILVIDDDASFRDAVSLLLQLEGHTVFQAGSGREAVAMQQRIQADVVLCDLIMPDLDGGEVMRALRRITPRSRIIAMSGAVAGGPEWQTAETSGADVMLTKPFSRYDLAATLESADDGHASTADRLAFSQRRPCIAGV